MKHTPLLYLAALALVSCGAPSSSSAPSSTPVESSSTSESSSSEEKTSSASSVTSEASSLPSSSPSSSVEEKLDPMKEPYIAKQYYLNHIGDIYNTWRHCRGKGITIAVIDVGFNPDHEDFTFADGTSKVSAKSASFITNSSGTTVEVGKDKVVNMGESHGSFCAGVAAAGLNGKGVVGIAPEAELMLLKTDAKPKSIAKAFAYAADNGARVITISIGSYYDYTGDLVNDGSDLGTVFDAPVKYCYDKGVPVISAGGNGGLDGQPTEFTFPGCVDHVIGVGGLAANSSSEIWEGSSYNSSREWQSIDVFAPADMMFGCCHYDGKKYDGGWNGTSFASPIVAGMAALYFEANPSKGAADFERDLYASCHALTSSKIATASQLGEGRVDIGALLGTKVTGNVTAKVIAPWTNCNAFLWNSVTGVSKEAWPGAAIGKVGESFQVTIDASKYDSLIFNNGTAQSLDLCVSAFADGATLNLQNAATEVGCLVGSYQ